MTSKYSSPCRRETCREATYRQAMAIPGRFKFDGCFREVVLKEAVGDEPAVKGFRQVNRKFRRSGGRSS